MKSCLGFSIIFLSLKGFIRQKKKMRKPLWSITNRNRSLSCYVLIRSHCYGILSTYTSSWLA